MSISDYGFTSYGKLFTSKVRYTSDDPDFHRASEDFKDFQERVRSHAFISTQNNLNLKLQGDSREFLPQGQGDDSAGGFLLPGLQLRPQVAEASPGSCYGQQAHQEGMRPQAQYHGHPKPGKLYTTQFNSLYSPSTAAPERAQGESHQEVETKGGHRTKSYEEASGDWRAGHWAGVHHRVHQPQE